MEEVWKNITTLSSSSSHHGHLPAAAVVHHQSSLHEFLASSVCPPTQIYDPKVACSKKVTDHSRPSQQVFDGGSSFPCSDSSPALSSVFASSLFPPQNRDSDDDNNGCCDRRYKRKMKNRESATRSRARRQAYTNELELEVAHLREENAMLKRQQEEICSAADAAATVAQATKNSTLVRSHTAPF
ncbi:hypothetical protein QQ045_015265 [Rhodiola kirilowii]